MDTRGTEPTLFLFEPCSAAELCEKHGEWSAGDEEMVQKERAFLEKNLSLSSFFLGGRKPGGPGGSLSFFLGAGCRPFVFLLVLLYLVVG